MKVLLVILAVVSIWIAPARADTADEVRGAYLRFAEAQNSRDLARVGAHFIDGLDFLWVSDGKSFWGRDAVLKRMGQFQRSEVWRVEPDLSASTVTDLGAGAAMLHMPLTLIIGADVAPNMLRFLVSIIFVYSDDEWRIAALLTTSEKS